MMFDIGILGAMSGLDPAVLLENDYGTYKGYFAENFVAQQLMTTGYEQIFSWQKDKSEVEFLISHRGDIVPVEVKSGARVKAKSLEKYINLYHPKRSIILSAKPIRVNEAKNVLHLPLYLAEKIPDLL